MQNCLKCKTGNDQPLITGKFEVVSVHGCCVVANSYVGHVTDREPKHALRLENEKASGAHIHTSTKQFIEHMYAQL